MHAIFPPYIKNMSMWGYVIEWRVGGGDITWCCSQCGINLCLTGEDDESAGDGGGWDKVRGSLNIMEW